MKKDQELIRAFKQSQKEKTYAPVDFALSSLPGTVIITEDLATDCSDDRERNRELLDETAASFESNAARLAYEIAKQSDRAGRVTRVYVEKLYREKMAVVGIGFRWAHETPRDFQYRECYVAPDGQLLIQDHTKSYGDQEEKGVDPTQFLEYYQQFITDPRYAMGECAGRASHITSLVED